MIEKKFGEKARLFVLENENGIKLSVTDFGARIVSLEVPTKSGKRNLILGFDSAEEYLKKDPYIGGTIGRVAGRISKGQFEIEGKAYKVETQPDGNCNHGGLAGFESKYWRVVELSEDINESSVIFQYKSPAGENGFPGNLVATVSYTLTNDNEWKVTYEGNTDEATLFNPTNHVYFNLTGDATIPVGEHLLQIQSDAFVVVAEDTTATGEIREVTGTPFDFRQGKRMREVFETDYSQNQLVGGLDHPFMLSKENDEVPEVRLIAPDGEVAVEVTTTAPSVVIFTANFGENTPMMHGKKMANHGGLTLETQIPPGAIEHEGFGNVILAPEEKFYSETIFTIRLPHFDETCVF